MPAFFFVFEGKVFPDLSPGGKNTAPGHVVILSGGPLVSRVVIAWLFFCIDADIYRPIAGRDDPHE